MKGGQQLKEAKVVQEDFNWRSVWPPKCLPICFHYKLKERRPKSIGRHFLVIFSVESINKINFGRLQHVSFCCFNAHRGCCC